MSYFAPHIPPYILKHLIEREMRAFRCYLGLAPDEPVDLFEIADRVSLHGPALDI